jgi:hypothetical protein
MTSLPSSKRRTEGLAGSRAAVAEADPLRALLAEIVDYAGLFPPAGLDMPSAVSAYDRYRTSGQGWMLGAFVVSAARLSELAAVLPEPGASSWPVSVLAPSLAALPKSYDARLEIRALEIAPHEPRAILAESGGWPEGVRTFFEVSLDERMESRLDAIERIGASAKVRTGGVTAEAFPPARRLAELVRACAERGVRFKATAGLHHAHHGCYPLTYERESASASMFGFLDFALVAALLRSARVDPGEAASLLTGNPGAVVREGDGLRWKGHPISATEIGALRDTLFLSFGSCSFEEPVADLKRMGLL